MNSAVTTDGVVSEFRRKLEQFTTDYLRDYIPAAYRDHYKEKVIHDPVWGSNRFHPWEMAVLDSPLLQRLRHIKQVGMAHLVYPTARHSRFDHTVGVVSVVSEIARALNAKAQQTQGCISIAEEFQLRMAAILHDVGHCLFSHVGERIYAERPEFRAVRDALNARFTVDPKPHETMSYLIVTTKAFRSFFDELRDNRRVTPEEVAKILNLDFIAEAIIGYWKSRPDLRYLVEIMNGPLDADKLDYLARDAYFAGLSVVYDFNRYKVTIDRFSEPFEVVGNAGPSSKNSTALKLPLSGVTALEQILISKMMLYSYMYHHQKVLAAESTLAAVFEDFSRGGVVNVSGRDVAHPVDLLYLTDETLERHLHDSNLREPGKTPSSCELLQFMLARRRLVKRALVVSRLFIKDLHSEENLRAKDRATLGFARLVGDLSDHARVCSFRKRLHEKAKSRVTDKEKKRFFHERFIVIDFPKPPAVHEVTNMLVPTTAMRNRPTELQKLFPLKEWAESYGVVQWKGYIFTLPGYRRAVCEAALELIKDVYGLDMVEEAVNQCSIPTSDHDATPMELYDPQLALEFES